MATKPGQCIIRVLILLGITILCYGQELNTYGPKCLNCKGVRDPAQCTSATKCWYTEQCYTEKYVRADEQVTYDFGCKPKTDCALISQPQDKRDDITIDLCQECCYGQFCNVNVCTNQTASPSLACYSCDDVGTPGDCHVLSRCGQDEICYAEKVITDGENPKHTLRCLSNQLCDFLKQGGHPEMEKSETDTRNSTKLCQKCCSQSGCNLEICGDDQLPPGVSGTTPSSYPWPTYPWNHYRTMEYRESHEWMTSGKLEDSQWTWSANGTRVPIDFDNLSGKRPSMGPCSSFMTTDNYTMVDVNCEGFPRHFICEKGIS